MFRIRYYSSNNLYYALHGDKIIIRINLMQLHILIFKTQLEINQVSIKKLLIIYRKLYLVMKMH